MDNGAPKEEAREPRVGRLMPEEPTTLASTREVRITKVTNGFIVSVGCKTFVAHSWQSVACALGEYWENPDKAQKKYCRQEERDGRDGSIR